MKTRSDVKSLCTTAGEALAPLDSQQRQVALGLLADRLLPASEAAAVIATLDAYDGEPELNNGHDGENAEDAFETARRLCTELRMVLDGLAATYQEDPTSWEAACDATHHLFELEKSIKGIGTGA